MKSYVVFPRYHLFTDPPPRSRHGEEVKVPVRVMGPVVRVEDENCRYLNGWSGLGTDFQGTFACCEESFVL